MKYLLSLCILAAAFFVNPLWGCGGNDEPAFTYDRQDMVDYAVGTWSGSLELPSGEETDFELVITEKTPQLLEQGLELREVKQPACGNREFSQNLGELFVRNAYACVSVSTLPIEARLTTNDGSYQDQALTGEVTIWGRNFGSPSIDIRFSDGGRLHAECDSGEYKCTQGAFSTVARNEPDNGEFVAMQKNSSR